jgi:hypothetical protein
LEEKIKLPHFGKVEIGLFLLLSEFPVVPLALKSPRLGWAQGLNQTSNFLKGACANMAH